MTLIVLTRLKATLNQLINQSLKFKTFNFCLPFMSLSRSFKKEFSTALFTWTKWPPCCSQKCWKLSKLSNDTSHLTNLSSYTSSLFLLRILNCEELNVLKMSNYSTNHLTWWWNWLHFILKNLYLNVSLIIFPVAKLKNAFQVWCNKINVY